MRIRTLLTGVTEFRNSKQKSMVGQTPPYEDYKVKRKKGQKSEDRSQKRQTENIESFDPFDYAQGRLCSGQVLNKE